jgi:hypothetical protein
MSARLKQRDFRSDYARSIGSDRWKQHAQAFKTWLWNSHTGRSIDRCGRPMLLCSQRRCREQSIYDVALGRWVGLDVNHLVYPPKWSDDRVILPFEDVLGRPNYNVACRHHHDIWTRAWKRVRHAHRMTMRDCHLRIANHWLPAPVAAWVIAPPRLHAWMGVVALLAVASWLYDSTTTLQFLGGAVVIAVLAKLLSHRRK